MVVVAPLQQLVFYAARALQLVNPLL
ncbi:hypothetical protein MPC4_340016 [Methylocella tundrae]|uniref:Uncharacterized protein n=1 Tax=Methylocella tundrae TaxID=227605 RepID=A0A8B6M8W5_METTU|nr:hypothetical protein MPC1_1750006 [Methylocella tundrae]VTZ51260.1 hypothetical protein MPC4_340016 [Methylocella tundrae]